CYLIFRCRSVEHMATMRLSFGHREKTLAQPHMIVDLPLLITIRILARQRLREPARGGAAQSYLCGDVENESEVRIGQLHHDQLERLEHVEWQSAGFNLVDARRIGEAIGDDPTASHERGTDHLLDMIGTRCIEQ